MVICTAFVVGERMFCVFLYEEECPQLLWVNFVCTLYVKWTAYRIYMREINVINVLYVNYSIDWLLLNDCECARIT